MEKKIVRAEILVSGLVQGVGFRYFVYQHAKNLGLKGYTKNLYSGEVYTIAEGSKEYLEELVNKLKIGPMHAHVKDYSVKWTESKNEFSDFEIRR